MIFLRGLLGLLDDLVNCLIPIEIPEPLDWTDDT